MRGSDGRLLPEVTEEERERYWREMEERAAPLFVTRGDPYVLFRLDAEAFALPVGAARAVVAWTDPTPLPYQPSHIAGVVMVRGRPVSVTRLPVLLGRGSGPMPRRHHLLVVAWETMETALPADSVEAVVRLEPGDISPPDPEDMGGRAGLVAGSATVGGERVCVLEPRHCLIEPGRA